MNATWLTLTEPEFQCDQVELEYSKRKDSEVVTKLRRLEKGCGVISQEPKVEIDNLGFYSCLCHENFKDLTFNSSLQLYRQYKKGHLYTFGGVSEQPAKYLELMGVLERLDQEQEIKAHKKQG